MSNRVARSSVRLKLSTLTRCRTHCTKTCASTIYGVATTVCYYSYTFTNPAKRQIVGVVSTDAGDAWLQLGVKLGSMALRDGFSLSGAPVSLGEYPPGAKVTPRDQQIGQQ